MPIPGDSFSKRHVFTAEEISAFAARCGDTNPLHHDPAAAARSRFGALIASGPHTTSHLMAMTAAQYSEPHGMVGLEFMFRFDKAVVAGTETVMSWQVTDVQPNDRIGADVVGLTGHIRDAAGTVLVSATGRILVWHSAQVGSASGDKT